MECLNIYVALRNLGCREYNTHALRFGRTSHVAVAIGCREYNLHAQRFGRIRPYVACSSDKIERIATKFSHVYFSTIMK